MQLSVKPRFRALVIKATCAIPVIDEISLLGCGMHALVASKTTNSLISNLSSEFLNPGKGVFVFHLFICLFWCLFLQRYNNNNNNNNIT